MARITVEDCLQHENNRFALVQLAAKRTKQLLGGGRVLIDSTRGNKFIVTALREIAAGKVRFMNAQEIADYEAELASAPTPEVEVATPMAGVATGGTGDSDASSNGDQDSASANGSNANGNSANGSTF